MPIVECSIETCDRPATERGWCHAHYMRWFSAGDVRPEVPLKRYVRGPEAQLAAYVNRAGRVPIDRPDLGPCWLWTGRTNKLGYGIISIGGRMNYAHRWAYQRHVGPIPEDLELDHLCRNPSCLNFESHLELVSHQTNVLRGESPPAQFARRDACSKGHKFTPENTFTRRDNSRGCRACDRSRSRQSYLRRKGRLSG